MMKTISDFRVFMNSIGYITEIDGDVMTIIQSDGIGGDNTNELFDWITQLRTWGWDVSPLTNGELLYDEQSGIAQTHLYRTKQTLKAV